MPDRYGEQPDHDTTPEPLPVFACQPGYAADHQAAIDACALCDPDGTRNGFACDHIDHRPAAARGMAAIRAAMGWNR